MLGIVEPPDIAWEWNERAMELARSSPDPAARRWVGSLANNMGWARHDAGDDDEAISHLRGVSRRVPRRRTGRSGTRRALVVARCLRSRGDAQEALAEQEALVAELDALGETDGYVTEEIAECLLALGRGDVAQPFFARAYTALSAEMSFAVDEPERLERLRSLGGA